jgi:hypothetical protein
MTSISWESSKKQRLNPMGDYEQPPRLPVAKRKDSAAHGERVKRQAVTKQPEFLSEDYFKERTSNGSFEKDLNASLLDFENYPSFLEPETNADELPLWNTSEKTSLLALSRFPDSQSSSSSAHSTSTIVNSPASSSSNDFFGGSLEPLIPDYFPEFFLGNEELLEKKPLEDSFQNTPFDTSGSYEGKPLKCSAFTKHVHEWEKKNGISNSKQENIQIGDGICPIPADLDSKDFQKILKAASARGKRAEVYQKFKGRLIHDSGKSKGNPVGYAAFSELVTGYSNKKKPENQIILEDIKIGDGISPIQPDPDLIEFQEVLEAASQHKKFEVYQRFKGRLIYESGKSKGNSITYRTFSKLVSTYSNSKKSENQKTPEESQIDDGISPIPADLDSEDFQKILKAASQHGKREEVYQKFKGRLIHDSGKLKGTLVSWGTFSKLVSTYLKPQKTPPDIPIGDGISPIRTDLDSEDFQKVLKAASRQRKRLEVYERFKGRLIHDSGKLKGTPVSWGAFSNLVLDYSRSKKTGNQKIPEDIRIGDGISPIRPALDSEDFQKILKAASKRGKKREVYVQFKERLIYESGKLKGTPLNYKTFLEIVSDYSSRKKPEEVSDLQK